MLFGKSWLFYVNYCLLQWFFIRLAKKLNDKDELIGYTILKWVVPFSGWNGRKFKYV